MFNRFWMIATLLGLLGLVACQPSYPDYLKEAPLEGQGLADDCIAKSDACEWEGGVIPYGIVDGMRSDVVKALGDAIKEWENKTALRFVPYQGHSDYIFFTDQINCTASIGNTGGKQNVGINGSCHGYQSRGLVPEAMYLMGLKVGLRPEHLRCDRDSFVKVLAPASLQPLFTKLCNGVTNSKSYDFDSIMHWEADIDNSGTDELMSLDPNVPLGKATELSCSDQFTVAHLYGGGILCQQTQPQIPPPPPSKPVLTFFEGTHLNGALACTIDYALLNTPLFPFGVGNCANDKASSLRIDNATAGLSFRLFDGFSGGRVKMNDDWVEIVVKQNIASLDINSFEQARDDALVRVTFHRNNGLNGEVSVFDRSPGQALGAVIDLYEGLNARGKLVCSVVINRQGNVDFTRNNDCSNDDASSARLFDVSAGKTLELFDSSSGNRNDDWLRIDVKNDIRSVTGVAINSLERSASTAFLDLLYVAQDNLNERVSRIQIDSFAAHAPRAIFYEGNNAAQDIVCTLSIPQRGQIDFTNHSECDNDEARSLKLLDVRAGMVIEVYDDSSCRRTADDYAIIRVLQDQTQLVISSFEQSLTQANVSVIYRTGKNLDGKVSCVILAG